MLCGYPPFDGDNDAKILRAVKEGKFTFPKAEWSKISQEAKDFISNCLQHNAENRHSAIEALNDPWIQKTAVAKELDKPLARTVFDNLKTFRVII